MTAADDAETARRRNRARARLRTLGIDPDATDAEQIRRIWEHTRAAYINNASAGLHLNPMRIDNDPLPGACLHARYGMFHQAIEDYFGGWPEGWNSPQIAWPRPGREPAVTVTVVQDPGLQAALPPATRRPDPNH